MSQRQDIYLFKSCNLTTNFQADKPEGAWSCMYATILFDYTIITLCGIYILAALSAETFNVSITFSSRDN